MEEEKVRQNERARENSWKKIRKLSDKEFKVLIVKMLTELGERIDLHIDNFNKELGNIQRLNPK